MSTNNLFTINQPQGQNWLPDTSQLKMYRQQDMHDLFASLPDANHHELNGNYRGEIYAIKGLDFLPRAIRSIIITLLQLPLPIWIGKSFDKKKGANLWLASKKPTKFGSYKILTDEQTHSLKLDYNISANPKALHPICGEVKAAGNNRFLARMLYRGKNKTTTVLYFTLTPLD